jgi:hypothetical protein
MPTPQIDKLFEALMFTDEEDINDLFILEQLIAGLSDHELKVCLSVAKKYKKNYGFFFDRLLSEKEQRIA